MGSVGVCLMGMSIVFAGLLCIVGLCKIMSLACGNSQKKTDASAQKQTAAPAAEEIPNREEMVAALSAVIAEELGTSVSAIRIVSLKRI